MKIIQQLQCCQPGRDRQNLTDPAIDKDFVMDEVKRVNKVFDQKSLMAGTGLLLKIMRQFEGVWEKKQFFLVKTAR